MVKVTPTITQPSINTGSQHRTSAGSRLLSRAWTITRYVLLGVMSAFALFPIIWLIFSSFKTNQEILAFPPTMLPDQWVWQNFTRAWQVVPFGRWYWNSFIVAAVVTTSVLLTSALAGYAFARLRFPGKRAIFLLLLSTLMIPFQTLMIPLFLTVRDFQLINTYTGLVLPSVVSVYGIFLMRQFISVLPEDLLDAARLDGASEFGVFLRIVLPNIRPALGTLGLFTFIASWDSFFWPLLVVNDQRMKTLPLGIVEFQGSSAYETEFGALLAASLMVMIPVLAVFLVAERQIIRGVALTGLKG